jgi:DNA-binding protein
MSAPTVLVGRKPVSSYVLACLHALQQNGSVEVRARGRAIPKAIGAVQVLREVLVKGLEVEYVDVGTERLQGKEDRLGWAPPHTLHNSPQLKGSLREAMSNRCVKGIDKDMVHRHTSLFTPSRGVSWRAS